MREKIYVYNKGDEKMFLVGLNSGLLKSGVKFVFLGAPTPELNSTAPVTHCIHVPASSLSCIHLTIAVLMIL